MNNEKGHLSFKIIEIKEINDYKRKNIKLDPILKNYIEH